MKSVVSKMKQYFTSMSNKKKALLSSIVLLLVLTIFIGKSFALPKPVRSIEIFSENTSFTNNDSGAWKVTKSAKWIGKGKARITFDVDSIVKTKTEYTDVIFVLDISESMTGEKLNRVKQDTIDLINTTLSNSNNRIALITFESTSTIVSDLTNDKNKLIELINNLQVSGCTNYYQALVNVDTVLKNYIREDNADTIVLFLTDGYPNEDIPNEEVQYAYLKSQYPYLTINGVQYEMGDTILDPIKKVSDNQFIADMESLSNVLFDASLDPIYYDEFTITDYLNNEYFEIESIDNIKASIGKVNLTEEDNIPKITWNIDGSLRTGKKETLTIDVTLKNEFLNQGGVYPTNKRTNVISKLTNDSENIETINSPILGGNYNVIYDGNAPSGCSVTNLPPTIKHLVFETVAMDDTKPSCNGYQFKGWEIVSKDITKVNDDYFIMPESDVIVRAVWSKLSVNKNMDGTISKVQTLYDVMAENAVLDNQKSEFVSSDFGIDFSKAPSNTNGKGVYELSSTKDDKYPVYYYRGEVYNNNVKFAGFCWKMVRTTSTGGVKLIYNGLPDVNGDCTNTTGTATQIGTSQFNSSYYSPADVGYMYGERINYSSKVAGKNWVYGNDITWDGRKYTLVDTATSDWSTGRTALAKRYHYTCLSTSNTCTSVKYIHYFGNSDEIYYLSLNGGDDIEQAKNKMFANTNSSTIKKYIDNWYVSNMKDYTDYLENTDWCNDRSFYSGSLKGKDEDAGVGASYFGAYGRNVSSYKPSVVCPNENDKLRVGNGLTYPVGLLTADELTMAGLGSKGYSSKSYLYTNQSVWFGSPYYFYDFDGAIEFLISSSGSLNFRLVDYTYGVRPSISLAHGIGTGGGDGTATDPYTLGEVGY